MNKMQKRKFNKQKKRCKELKKRGPKSTFKTVSRIEANYWMLDFYPKSSKIYKMITWLKVRYRAFKDWAKGREYCRYRLPGDVTDRIYLRIRP